MKMHFFFVLEFTKAHGGSMITVVECFVVLKEKDEYEPDSTVKATPTGSGVRKPSLSEALI